MKTLIIKRIIEVICVEIFLSLLGMSLYFFNLLNDYRVIFFTSAFILVLYIIWTVRRCYKYRVNHDGKKIYYLVNAPFYLILFGSAIITGIFDTERVYSFLFMPFKLFHYAALAWRFPGWGYFTRPVSAALVSILIAIPVVIIPFYLSTDHKAYIKKVG